MKKYFLTNKSIIPKNPHIAIGIMCYNKEGNITHLLESIHNQTNWRFIKEIIIISSGSTDKTNKLVLQTAKKNKKIKLYIEKRRSGKAHAVNLFLKKSTGSILVLISADLLLKKNSLSELVKPMYKKNVGIVGSHPIPINDKETFFGFASHLTWKLHHLVSLNNPKMGEMIAFKKCFNRIPVLTSVDEVNIEALIRGQGYKAVYAPRAIVYNKGPEIFREYISRRRSNYVGHLTAKHEYSYTVSTLNNMYILLLLLKNFKIDWRYIFWTPCVIVLEVYCRVLGYYDYKYNKYRHTIWEIARSTKKLK